MTQVDDNPTLLYNEIPSCAGCKNSFLSKERCAVFSCKHRFCEDCCPLKTEKCKGCGAGDFILFLDEVPDMNTVHQRLKENINTYSTVQDANLARTIFKDLARLQQQIDNEIRRRQEPQATNPAIPVPEESVKESESPKLPQPQQKLPVAEPAPQPSVKPSEIPKKPQPSTSQAASTTIKTVEKQSPKVDDTRSPKAPKSVKGPSKKACCSLL